MDLVLAILAFCLGVGLLVKGADWLVDAATRIARHFGVSNFLIGLTVIAFGTTLPEFGASVMASFYGDSDLALGNIIGSNIANIALILGLAGLFVPIALKKELYNKEGAVLIFSAILLYLLCLGGTIGRIEGGFLILLFFAYLFFIIRAKKKQAHKSGNNSLEGNAQVAEKNRHGTYCILKQAAVLAVGLVCVFFGSQLVVESAMSFPINQLLVGLVFVAVGTSLPELFIAITSLRKGVPEMTVGNIIGSNIANILWIGGVSAIVNPIKVSPQVIQVDFVFLLLITWLFLFFVSKEKKMARTGSLVLLLIYAAFLAGTFASKAGA